MLSSGYLGVAPDSIAAHTHAKASGAILEPARRSPAVTVTGCNHAAVPRRMGELGSCFPSAIMTWSARDLCQGQTGPCPPPPPVRAPPRPREMRGDP